MHDAGEVECSRLLTEYARVGVTLREVHLLAAAVRRAAGPEGG